MANTPRLVTTKQAKALAELYVWDTVVEILEGSTAPRDASGQKAALRVIAIAKAEQKKLFRKYEAEARHDDFAALQAEVEALRAEVEAWRELSDHVHAGVCNAIWPDRYVDERIRDVAAALKRAERLAEALRHQRWCRTCAEDGWESCEEGRKNDALLRDQEEGK